MISWYFLIAIVANFISTFAYQIFSRSEKCTDELIIVMTRCIVASYALMFISISRLLIKSILFYAVMIVIGIISFIVMFNIEKLPIWEDDGKE